MIRCPAHNVCVVEDDADTLASIQFLLEAEGYVVFPFQNGSNLMQHVGRSAPPFCCIIDYKLPNMDGLELAQRLRTERPGLAWIIMITGHPDPSIRKRVEEAGLDLFEKPLLQEALLLAVRAAMQSIARQVDPGEVCSFA